MKTLGLRLFVIALLGFFSLSLRAANPPSQPPSPPTETPSPSDFDRLNQESTRQRMEIEILKNDLRAHKEELATLRSENDAMEDQLHSLEKDAKSPWEAVAFYLATFLTVAGTGAVVLGVFWGALAFFATVKPLLNIEKIAEDTAEKKIQSLHDYLTGRFNLATGIIFSRITWDKQNDYAMNAIQHLDFGEEALFCANSAWKHLKNCGYSNTNRKLDALNNVLFYSALAKGARAERAAAITDDEATKIINLAAEFKAYPEFMTKPLFINTYCLVIIAFHKYLGDGSPSDVLANLSEVEEMLKVNRSAKSATKTNKSESYRLLNMLNQFRLIINLDSIEYYL